MIQLQVFCIKTCLHHQSFLISAPYHKKNPGSAPDKRIQLKRKTNEKKKMRKKAVSIKMLPERYKIAMGLVGHLTAQWWIQGRGTGPQAPWPPLFLNQNEAWRLKNVDPSPFIYLDDRASIFLSQGLDPALLLTPMGVACIFATCMTENRVCKNRGWKIESLGQSPLVKTNSDILHPRLYGDMDYINCRAKIVDQKLQCWFRAQFASFSLQT